MPRFSRWPDAPRIVAEALRELAEPLASVVRIGPQASADAVARAIAASLALPMASETPPSWLRPAQLRSFGRARAALDRYGGALLAEPVGSGKSWIALALAASEARGGPATVIVPAALLDQWRTTAARIGVPIRLWSHERLSRGRTPEGRSGLVIVDESHRFRNPATRRYRTLAPWLVGRRTLLLSATPVVNRLDDLAAQLLLSLPDDALRATGLPSIRNGLGHVGGPGLGEVVIASIGANGGGPGRRNHTISLAEWVPADLVRAVDELTNSRKRPIARLLRGVAWQAAASSPAALVAVLTGYRSLLHHAADARREGRPLERAELRRFTGGLAEQLVLWSLLEESPQVTESDLDLDDLPRLAALIPAVRRWQDAGDAKLARLSELVSDGRSSLVFTVARATVRYLRDRLPHPVAWSSGGRAGLGAVPVGRDTVWSWFAPNGSWHGTGPRPAVLVSTDVAAEGLDLQRAARVVHYDLPWTPVRLAQRDGRAIRLGSLHQEVEIVSYLPPPEIERRLALGHHLDRKAALPASAGLGPAGRALWQWREELARSTGAGPAASGCAAIENSGLSRGALIGVVLRSAATSSNAASIPALFWLPESGEPSEAVADVEPRLRAALGQPNSVAPTEWELEQGLARLWPALRSRLAAADQNRWRGHRAAPEAGVLVRRLHRLMTSAVRRRDRMALAAVDRGLRFVARGHSAGEAKVAAELVSLSDRALLERVARLADREVEAPPLLPVMVGVLVFR